MAFLHEECNDWKRFSGSMMDFFTNHGSVFAKQKVSLLEESLRSKKKT